MCCELSNLLEQLRLTFSIEFTQVKKITGNESGSTFVVVKNWSYIGDNQISK